MSAARDDLSFGPETVTRLAESDAEWKAIAASRSTDFLRSMDEWDQFIARNDHKSSVLGALSNADLAEFREHLSFDEATRNGVVFRRCCSGWYYGVLVKKYDFTTDDLVKVAALFGIGPDRFAKTQDKFGDLCDGEVCCRPRPYYNCPDGKPNCSC